jgi:pimeloyl-ACP methyl ester carboxylesterase
MSLPGRFLTIGGTRVFHHRAGRGKPLVLLHGWMVSHWVWRHILPTLAAEYDVVALDLPGFGESDRPSPTEYGYDAVAFGDTLIGVLDALAIERATLVGHSMGGGVALHTAARRPERVDRLVLVDPLAYPFPIPLEGKLILTPYLGEVMFRALTTRALVRHFLKRHIYFDPGLATDEWIDYLWERMNRPGGFGAATASLRFCARPDVIARNARAVRAPSLVVWGEEDRLFPATSARRLGDDLHAVDVTLIPRCGHAPQEERPDELVRMIGRFLGLPRGEMRAVS